MIRSTSPLRRCAAAAIVGLTVILGPRLSAVAGPPVRVSFGPGRVLVDYGGPRIALAGDADGDGNAGFLGVYQPDGIIDFLRMSPAGKLFANVQARAGLGKDIVAAACGHFAAGSGASVLMVCHNGEVRVARDMDKKTHRYRVTEFAATIPGTLLPQAPVQVAVGDFDRNGRPDVLLAGADGRWLLLHALPGPRPRFVPLPVRHAPAGVRRLAAGRFAAAGPGEVVWLDGDGVVRRAALHVARVAAGFDAAHVVTHAAPGDGLCAGRFLGGGTDDLVVGQRLLPGADAARAIPQPNLPGPAVARSDVAWIAADFNGDGKDDLMRCRRSSDPLDGSAIYLHYAHCAADDPGLAFDDADNDGLPDAWETGRIHPGGIDLPALGCSPKHADIIVEVQPFADVPTAVLDDGLAKVKEYFASVPVHNPDGVDGIAIHFIRREPIPTSEGSAGWEALHEKYHARNHRGVTHWMLVYKGGGGQSGGFGEGGQCGCYGMPGVFIHELGHQFGLDHTGRWPLDHNPLYHSVMNYVYNYALDRNGKTIGYSHGDLLGIVLNPLHLTERLPVPPEKVAFIAGPPYRFHIKPDPDGHGTLVDWNWNGVFGETNIAADINYAYSTTAGERHRVDRAYSVPAPAVVGLGADARLLVFYGKLAANAKGAKPDASAQPHTVSASMPGSLAVRLWLGHDVDRDGASWSDAVEIAPSAVSGDPSACSLGSLAWVAYPTADGAVVRSVALRGDTPVVGAPALISGSTGAQVTLTPSGGRLALLLWRDRSRPVGLRLIDVEGAGVAPAGEVSLGFTSSSPVGAAQGAGSTLWIGGTLDDGAKKSRWQVHAVTLGAAGVPRTGPGEWIGGDRGGEAGDGRISVLWEAAAGLGEGGQTYLFGRGGLGFQLNQEYIAMRIADANVNGGWLTRRYYDEWTNSRLSCGVCWFRGDVVYASSMFGDGGMDDNNMIVAFHGRGIQDGEMGDFDDVDYIRDLSMRESIGTLAE